MYWWKVNSLANELKDETVSETERMKYLMAVSLMVGVGTLVPREGSLIEALMVISVLAITFFGILLCFAANRAGAGKNFIERFLCLSFPGTIRLLVYAIPLFFVVPMFHVFLARGNPDENTQQLLSFVVSVVFTISYFMWVRSKLMFISGAAAQRGHSV